MVGKFGQGGNPMLKVSEIKEMPNDLLLEQFELKLIELVKRQGSGVLIPETMREKIQRLKEEIFSRME